MKKQWSISASAKMTTEQCRKDTEFVSIISRNTQIDDAKLEQIHNKIKRNLCVDISDFVRPHQDYGRNLDGS